MTALVMLAGVHCGSERGGSIASILLDPPGTPSSSVACLDGYPMARRGRAGPVRRGGGRAMTGRTPNGPRARPGRPGAPR